ncbi:MAG: SAM-dependent methyltransferase [Anaeromicrobium sp.]|jgi:SAM-dependent methyltransferase|uniref:class I SAM-dependent methyltransferase n=1 Tax=Anaeromicrobium sp. TaxID=1929132 RepID=UPI0025CF347A|nr:SAM-dependent methyltransferase [Anaeromicrobium sp.]MCT4594280.1 SAM-dependent methyltransferase [Anaeromicrobium sp.]
MNSKEIVKDIMENEELIQAILSNKRKKDIEYNKVNIRPILIKDELLYQFTYVYDNKEIHKNISKDEAIEKMRNYINLDFKQCQIYGVENDYQILVSKKFKEKILKKKPSKKLGNISHNRKKKYIIEEDKPCDFLMYLGVMNKEGKVKSQKRDKFRQINRFLEMVRDVESNLHKDKELKIIDFGCGKSYLTFALYYYLVKVLNLKVNIIGLDLKKDVVEYCNQVSKNLGYMNLSFQVGNIGEFNEFDQVDMVVTLHACDTATDMALFKAICWNSEIILSVPCCQHELMNQVKSETLKPILKHGIIKERFSSLATDSARVNLLELIGYDTQIIEFIETEHTPKNLLIRAIKSNNKREELLKEYKDFKEFLSIEPYLEKLLVENNMINI